MGFTHAALSRKCIGGTQEMLFEQVEEHGYAQPYLCSVRWSSRNNEPVLNSVTHPYHMHFPFNLLS